VKGVIAFVLSWATAAPVVAAARYDRPLIPAAAGWNRIVPDALILGAARPLRYLPGVAPEYAGGMEDLRLLDAAGRQLPFLLIAPLSRKERWIEGTLSPGSPAKDASSVELDLGAIREVDTLEVSGISPPWLKKIRLDGSGDRTRWNVLAAEATLFDLPEKGLANRKIAFTPGEFRYLRLTWDDRGTARVPAGYRLRARRHDEGAAAPSTPLPVQFSRRASERRVSRYRLLLPAAHLPVMAIVLDVANRDVDRSATVTEARLTGGSLDPITLGSARLLKTESGGATASSLIVPVSFPESGELELSVDDGDNPPLIVVSVRAVMPPLPTLCFETPTTEPLVARYGDANLNAPHYDLEASRASLEQRLSSIPEARWGAGSEQAGAYVTDDIPVPTGGLLDTSGFSRSRAIPGVLPGLTSLRLDPQLMGETPSLADVRIADAHKHQVPYLVERLSSDQIIALPISRKSEGSCSVYRLSVPLEKLPPGSMLRLATSSRVFERNLILQRPAEPGRNRLAERLDQSVWRGDPAHVQYLALPIPEDDPSNLEIVIDEGDNAPLPIISMELMIKSAALRFVHPGGQLTLLYGKRGLAPPRYDIELLATRLLEAPAREISLPPAARTVRPAASASSLHLFWAAVAAVAVVLLVLLSRLLRHDVGFTEP
jgi:hypothetical protein